MPCCAKLLRTNSKISLFNVAQNILTVTDFEAKKLRETPNCFLLFDNNFLYLQYFEAIKVATPV